MTLRGRQSHGVHVEGDVIESTGRHPYWVVRGEDLDSRPVTGELGEDNQPQPHPGRWVEARHLRVGDRLWTNSAGEVPIEDLLTYEATTEVYNFHVAECRSYAIGESAVLVHNQSVNAGCEESDCRKIPNIKKFSTGGPAEDYLRSLYPGSHAQQFETQRYTGAARFRYVDAYDAQQKIAHESKIGEVHLQESIQKEINKDLWLIQNDPEVKEAIWHFFCSENTGKMGPDEKTRQALISAGIKIVIHQ